MKQNNTILVIKLTSYTSFSNLFLDRFADSCQQTCMTYTIAVFTVKTPDDGQRNRSKHV